RREEARYVHALAPQQFTIKGLGVGLQTEAFRQTDLLPVYGSSEVDSYLGPFHPSDFFDAYPTGFTVFPVGAQGTTALIVLQKLAAIGSELQGKKVVILISPTYFRKNDRVRQEYYAGNYSRLQA